MPEEHKDPSATKTDGLGDDSRNEKLKTTQEDAGSAAPVSPRSGLSETERTLRESSQAAATESSKKPIRPKQVAPATSMNLLRAVYGEKRPRFRLKKAEIAAIFCGPTITPTEREELLRLAALDRTLDRTRDLMLLSLEGAAFSGLGAWLRHFISHVLRQHPAFVSESLAGVLENTPDSPSDDRAIRALISRPFSGLDWPQGLPRLTKKQAEHCRSNALWCLLLWFHETRGISLEQIQQFLYKYVWDIAARRHKTNLEKLKVLATTRENAGIGVACSVFENQAAEQRQNAIAAEQAEERVRAHASELAQALAKTETELEAAKAQLALLHQEVKDARASHQNEMAHMRNDYEELRGRVLHRLREEVSLLDDGLQALRREPPKIHVMQDHAERAIGALKREIERLKQVEPEGDQQE